MKKIKLDDTLKKTLCIRPHSGIDTIRLAIARAATYAQNMADKNNHLLVGAGSVPASANQKNGVSQQEKEPAPNMITAPVMYHKHCDSLLFNFALNSVADIKYNGNYIGRAITTECVTE